MDANFILIPFQFNVDIFAEFERILGGKYEIEIPKKVIEELEYLSKGAEGRDKMNARSALKMIKGFEIVEGGKGNTDEVILSLARSRPNTIICTNDKVLKREARKKQIPVIYLRQKRRLEIDGFLGS